MCVLSCPYCSTKHREERHFGEQSPAVRRKADIVLRDDLVTYGKEEYLIRREPLSVTKWSRRPRVQKNNIGHRMLFFWGD